MPSTNFGVCLARKYWMLADNCHRHRANQWKFHLRRCIQAGSGDAMLELSMGSQTGNSIIDLRHTITEPGRTVRQRP